MREGTTARGRVATLSLAVAGLTLGGCSEPEPAAEQVAAPVEASAVAVPAGKQLYDTNCASCHGVGALGDGPAAVGLPVKPANIREHFGDHSFDEMVVRVVEGIPPAMPPAPISTDEVREVLSWVWSEIPDSAQARLRALQELAAEEH